MKNLFQKSYLFILFAFVGIGNSFAQTQDFDKLNSADQKLHFLDSILFIVKYEPLSKTDSIEKAIFQNSAKDQPFQHYFKSEIQKSHSNYRIAASHIDTALYYSYSPNLLARLFLKKGQLNSILDRLPEAYKSFNSALDISKALEDTLLIAKVYTSKGEFERKAYEYTAGLATLDSALFFLNAINNYGTTRISAYDRLAAIHNEIGEIDKGFKYSFKALSLAKQQNDIHLQAVSHNELGFAYEHINKIDSAEFHYLSAIQLWKEIEALRYLSNAQTNLARLYINTNKLKEAEDLLLEIERNTIHKKWYELYPMMYQKLAEIKLRQKDSLNYYKYNMQSESSSALMLIEENRKKMYELSVQHEQRENLSIIKNQKSEIAFNETNLKLKEKQTNQLTWFLSISFVLLAITIFLWWKSRKNERNIIKMNHMLVQTVKEKEALIREVHHRVKNNFQMVHSLMTLRSLDIDDPEAVNIFDEMQSRIHSMAIVHEQLYSGSSLDRVKLKEFLNDIVGSLAHSNLTSQDFLSISGSDVKVHIEQAIPIGMIIHELATNSMKYAWKDQSNKKINIHISTDGNKLKVDYQDNGVGLPDNFTLSKPSSFGLKLVNLFIKKQLKGEIQAVNSPKGAIFELQIPLRK